VDDEIGSSRLLKANLELTGLFEVRIENRPENAVGAAREFKPHLCLLDIIMPTLSGTQLAALLQADPELNSIPIVFLTAASTDLLPQGSDPILHGRPWISKPARMEDILESVKENLALLPFPEAQSPAGTAQFPGAHHG